MFINKGHADRLARRPADVPKSRVTKLGVLGAGMMGAGIANVAAQAGIDVMLLDSTPELAAARPRAYARAARARRRARPAGPGAGRRRARTHPPTTGDYADLAGCDLVIEAVFEDRAVKADVTAKAEAVLAEDAVFASNTSTLPITGLAKASKRPETVHRHPLLLAGREDAAGGDHRRQATPMP